MKRILRAFITIAASIVMMIAFVGTAGTASAATKFVNGGQSIQKAIDAAKPGDTIIVRGVHRENVIIKKNRIKLLGVAAVLMPPATPAMNECIDPTQPTVIHGICVRGKLDPMTQAVISRVSNVMVSGFTIRGFSGSGIVAMGARRATFQNNVARKNVEYGIAAFSSRGTNILNNRVYGSHEAGLYVGDSPRSNALVSGNHSNRNALGLFIRNARYGTAQFNWLNRNCLGLLVLAGAPGPAGNFHVTRNKINNNTKVCPPGDEAPPISGIGVAVLGGRGMRIDRNTITGNKPSGPTAFQGGVLVVEGIAEPGGPPPSAPINNKVQRNTILRNQPDIVRDGTGSGNVLRPNLCKTSTPAGICP